MQTQRLNILLAGLLASATLSSGVLAIVELGRSRPDQPPLALTFDVGEDAIASNLVENAKSSSELEQAADHASRALSLSPYNNNARLRLAFIDSKLHRDRLSPEGARYIAQSYALVPYDPTIAAWRIRFALENWRALDTDARRAVQAETYALGRRTAVSGKIRNALQSVQDPVGRIPAQLWLLILKLRDAQSSN
jgi:hypothetical protein